MTDREIPLAPEALAERLAEVFDLVGPVYRRAQRKVEGYLPGEEMSVGVRAVLTLLAEHGPLTVPQMGRELALSRQFVQRMVNDALARELVELAENPAHRRSSLVRPTPAGTSAITGLLAREREMLAAVGGGLTAADLDGCVRVLARLLRFLDDADPS
ncbi:MarR family transcriptional regulator [Actinocorallia aurea]